MIKRSRIAVTLASMIIAGAAGLPALVRAEGKISPQKSSPGKAPKASPLAKGGIAAPSAVRVKEASDVIFGKTIAFHNLSLVPVSTTKTGPFQKYTLLEAGLEKKTLVIRELKGNSSAAEVNAIEVKNSDQNPVYLLGGEMILGGKQDRIIQNDTVVPNNQKWTRVAVFCVEQSRWSGQNMKFSAGQALAHVGLRQAALSGDQSKVWATVDAKNKKHGTQSATNTYRRTIQNQAIRRKIAPYREQILKQLPQDKQLAGLVFGINGKIRVADLFGNPLLFHDLREKLLTAYVLEAMGQRVERDARPITTNSAEGFIGKGRKAPKMKLKSSGRSMNYKIENEDQIGAETIDQKTGKRVRETYINK